MARNPKASSRPLRQLPDRRLRGHGGRAENRARSAFDILPWNQVGQANWFFAGLLSTVSTGGSVIRIASWSHTKAGDASVFVPCVPADENHRISETRRLRQDVKAGGAWRTSEPGRPMLEPIGSILGRDDRLLVFNHIEVNIIFKTRMGGSLFEIGVVEVARQFAARNPPQHPRRLAADCGRIARRHV